MIKLSKAELVKMDEGFIYVLASSNGERDFKNLSGNRHKYKYLSLYQTEDNAFSLCGYKTAEDLKRRFKKSMPKGKDGRTLVGVWNLETKKEVEVVTEVSVTIKE